MLTRDIAERIVSETMARLRRNINMMDQSGRIIASGDATRIGEIHVGAREAIISGEVVCIGEEELHAWNGAQPGVNIPIRFQGEIVGAVGISGNPDELLEVAQLACMTAELMLRQSYMVAQQAWRNRLKESLFEECMKSTSNAGKVEELLKLLHGTA